MNNYKRLALFLGIMGLYAVILVGLLIWDLDKEKQRAVVEIKTRVEIVRKKLPQIPRPSATESAKKYSWWYTGNNDHAPVQISPVFARLMKDYGGIWLGDAAGKNIYLTFDEGYENGYTASILEVLREKKVSAAFFITSSYLKKNPDLVRRMLAEGHIVGNHSLSHKSMPLLKEEEMEAEIEGLAREFKELTGQEIAPFFRPPMGEFSPLSLWVASQRGYYSVFWSFAYRDWETNNQKGKDYAFRKVMDNHHPGALLLLHAVSRDNAEALGEIIDGLRGEGYELRPLNTLIAKILEEMQTSSPL